MGAWGLGWEVWLNGMEVSQFTYFQQVGGLDCRPVMGEITYGLERLGMYIQGKESIFDIVWTDGPSGTVTYGDVFHQNEVEQSDLQLREGRYAVLLRQFETHEAACRRLLEDKLVLPAYEQMVKASHTFNLLDARRAVSVTERQRFILRVRTLARAVAEAYRDSREALGFPLLKALRRRRDRAWRQPHERARLAARAADRGVAAADAVEPVEAHSRRASSKGSTPRALRMVPRVVTPHRGVSPCGWRLAPRRRVTGTSSAAGRP